MNTQTLNVECEQAIRLLADHMPLSDEKSRKPALFHDIRVGVTLYERGYSRDRVLAGILHDALEWSEITEGMIRDQFGDGIAEIVLACTKNDSIKDPKEKIDELIKRCIKQGKDALIVKTADILDSFKYYTAVDNKDQLEYCKRNADAIFRCKPDEWGDALFDELKKWYSRDRA